MDLPLVQLAIEKWPFIAVAIAIVVVSFGMPMLIAEVFPYKNLWKQRNAKLTVTTKSYKGKTVLITGANGAFGSRAAKLFADREVETLILVDVRDCAGVKADIEAGYPATLKKKPTILVWQVDMMSYASCEELAKKVRTLKSLDHVLMTAGILSFKRVESPEGWETCKSFYCSQLNLFTVSKQVTSALLGLLILPVLKSSPSNPSPPVLTFVTTFGIYPASPTMGVPKKGSYLRHLSNNKDGMAQAHQYGRSKGLLLYFARELAARVSEAQSKGFPKVTVNSADPGSAWTPLTNPNQQKLIPKLIMDFSARNPLTCATALVNGVSASEASHGGIVTDGDLSS
jgi:NAD(P)-dependent dehydrogenase (short-subunit alcohol dehydrogenase family)